MSANYRTKNGWTSKRGAFLNGAWHCDCEPRLPADKFQTKNGGKNHGRWFYTCQKGKPKDCKFFLWTDDAKLREESVVFGNSRSEPTPAQPQTPRKMGMTAHQQPTPNTRNKSRDIDSQVTIDFEQEESFDWPSSNDEELAEVARRTPVKLPSPPPKPVFETPRKAARTTEFPSPGIRANSKKLNKTPINTDVFATPTTSHKSTSSRGLLSPLPTPVLDPSQASRASSPPPSTLAREALSVLRKNPIPLLPSVEESLIDLLNRHDLRTQGVARGRDISRLAVQAKEKRIAELQSRITGLEAERETQRLVIDTLKQDMKMSSTPRRRRSGEFGGGRKSEI